MGQATPATHHHLQKKAGVTTPLFHATCMGAKFYERTVPELVRQIARLDDNLERLVEVATPNSEATRSCAAAEGG